MKKQEFVLKLTFSLQLSSSMLKLPLLRATRGARNPNLQVVITQASHICSQHKACSQHSFLPSTHSGPQSPSFLGRVGLGTRMPSTNPVWNAQKALWSRAFGPSITRYLITRVLTTCFVKFTQSTALGQKRFDLSLSRALRNLRLSLIYVIYISDWIC